MKITLFPIQKPPIDWIRLTSRLYINEYEVVIIAEIVFDELPKLM